MIGTIIILGVISYLFAYFWKINLFLLLFLLIFYSAWPSLWRIFHVFFFHQPAFIINTRGIRLFPSHIPSSFCINWPEIQSISVEQDKSGKYICVYPKNKEEYISHISRFKRFILWIWNLKGKPMMFLSVHYLDKPVIEIFQQIAHEYVNELHQYEIQLQF